jgi:hypothetical protein
MTLVDSIVAAVAAHPAVVAVDLVGSQLDGTSTPLSDWDFKIEASDKQRVFDELPSVILAFHPLAAFWDPLGEHRNYMAIFPGLLKLDLHLDMAPLPARPWVIGPETLHAVDAHFWDWTLWLAGKKLKGRDELVTNELVKMHHYLLGPLGAERLPEDLDEAVATYLLARSEAEATHATPVAGNPLETEIRAALRHHGFD